MIECQNLESESVRFSESGKAGWRKKWKTNGND